LGLMVEALVVVVNRDRQNLLRVILADHVVVENFANLLWRRNSVARLHQRGFVLLANDVHAKFDALVADENGRPGNELAHLVLALAAERAVESVLRIATTDFAHSILQLPYSSIQASFAPGFQHGGPCFGGSALRPLPQHLKRSMLTT